MLEGFFQLSFNLQGSELAGWALGRYSYEGIDMNHNFADLNSVMWTAIELETDRSKLINHYFPIPEQYTSEEAFVSKYTLQSQLHMFVLRAAGFCLYFWETTLVSVLLLLNEDPNSITAGLICNTPQLN